MKKSYEDVVYKYTNRQEAQQAKLGRGWCMVCDRALVGFGSKCPVCGKSDGTKRFKKTGL